MNTDQASRRNPDAFGLAVLALAASLLIPAAASAYDPAVVTVPWLGNPNLPHQVYSGGSLVLQGTAVDLDTGNALCVSSATWDSGAGPTYNAGGNGYALEATHTYVGAVGQPFTATLTVTLCDTTVLSDTMRVVVRADNQEVRVNMAIDKGLWNLHKRINRTISDGQPSGFWRGYSSYYMAATASSVQAFEINNHRESGDRAEDPYVDDVARGLRYILSQQHGRLQKTAVNLQNGNVTDSNGNGYGLGINHGRHASYLGGQLIDAIVASGTPDKLAVTGPAGVVGRSYKDIVQDMLDGYSDGMSWTYGGWWYSYRSFGGLWNANDTSASHWWAIGVLAAEVWGLDAPEWLKDRQWTRGVPLMQRYAPPDSCYFGYTNSQGYAWDIGLNTTAAGLILMNADDIPQSHPRYACAEGWLSRFWNTGSGVIGNFYSMYQLTKAMRTAVDDTGASAPIETLYDLDYQGNPTPSGRAKNWYSDFADHLIGNQRPDGSFYPTRGTSGCCGFIGQDAGTSWALIMLSPSLFELPPQAVCNASPLIDGTAEIGGNVNFDGSQSAHPDPERTIVSYSWDFDDLSPGAVGETTSHSFADVGIYNVVLTVEDDNGNKDTDICQIDVRDNDIPPNANPGGPYTFCLGDAYELDGSGSSDLDNDIVSYEWDISSPINFAAIDSTDVTWTAPGTAFPAVGLYDIGLQVTDNDGSNGGTDHTSQGFTTVNVIPADDPSCNQPPVAVCADVTVSADEACQASASVDAGSNDPDGADDIASIVETPGGPYELGATTVTLTITDVRGLSDSCEATVTVIDDTAPVISCPANAVLECPADLSVAGNGSATATDNCSVGDPVSVDDSVAECNPTQVVTRTWTATDGSGNAASCDQVLDENDTIAPTITQNPGQETVECNVETYTEAGAVASDACDPDVPVTIGGAVVDPSTVAGYSITYDASDDCGNPAAQSVRTVNVVDTTAPTLTLSSYEDITVTDVDCSGAEPVAIPTASATDLCDPDVPVSNDAPDPFPAGQTTTVTYTATDDSGNSSTAGVDVTVLYGADIEINANKHTVGGGSHPGSNKEPLVGIEVCAYDKLGDDSCSRTVCGGISHQHYQCIVDSCGTDDGEQIYCCTTDAAGECTINAPPGDYIVISADATKTTLPDPLGVSASDLVCGERKQKHLQQIVKNDGKKVPGKTTRRTGSELLIIEPEFTEWTDTQELYPVVFESVGDWNADSSVEPPEGFVSDYDTLTEQVTNELEAVQFTLTDIGSDWVPTETKYALRHKGRKEIVLSRIGKRLSAELARAKGLDRDGHPLGPNGKPRPHAGFDPRYEWPVEIAGWIEPSAVDAGHTVKLTVSRTSDLELAITRGQGRVVQLLADGEYAPGDYAFAYDSSALGPGQYWLRLSAGDLVQKVKLLEK